MGTSIDAQAYLASLQCTRRLHLSYASPASGPDGDVPELFELDRLRDAWLERQPDLRRAGGLDPTALRALADDPALGGLADVRIEAHGLVARIDGLRRSADPQRGGGGGGWVLLVVSPPAERTAAAVDRAVFAWFVLGAAGLACARAELVGVDAPRRGEARVRERTPPDGIHFRSRDVTEDVRFLAGDVPQELARARAVLARASAPAVDPSPHCRGALPCPHWEECTRDRDDDDLTWLPRASTAQIRALRDAGRARISALPDDALRNAVQRRARTALRERRLVVDPSRAGALPAERAPCLYLDFEAYAPAVPRLPGMAPFEAIPLVWALLARVSGADPSGDIAPEAFEPGDWDDFAAAPGVDPRPAFARALVRRVAAYASDLPIFVYSTFEAEVLTALADVLRGSGAEPDLVDALRAIARRTFDLCAWVRAAAYHPAFRGSFSLKRVVAALAGADFYAGLGDVRTGADAALTLRAWIEGSLPDPVAALDAVRRYCARDVAALAAVHLVLVRAGREPSRAQASSIR